MPVSRPPQTARVFGHNGVSTIAGLYNHQWYFKSELGILTAMDLSFHTDAEKTPFRYVNDAQITIST